jgi:hypothetical protein
MSEIENIVSVVIISMFVLIGGFIVYQLSLEQNIDEYQLQKQHYLSDSYSIALHTIFELTHPVAKQSISSLVSSALAYRTELITVFSNQTFFNQTNTVLNVTSELEKTLNEVFGEGTYYLEVTPGVIEVSLNFIIDGSPSLNQERSILQQHLPAMLDTIQSQINKTGKETVVATMYLLGDGSSNGDSCQLFTSLNRKDITCFRLTASDLYLSQVSTTTVSYDSTAWDSYKYVYNVTSPILIDDLLRSQNDYAEADWASGVSYVSAKTQKSAKLILLFPVGDELATSSIHTSCFTDPMIEQKRKMCDICKTSCDSPASPTVVRAKKAVDIATRIAKNNSHIVVPIFAYTCDYDYKFTSSGSSIFNAYYRDYWTTPKTNPSMTCGTQICACSMFISAGHQNNCQGCSSDSLTGGVCFHSECKQTILEHMSELANQTGGSVINIADISTLVSQVQKTVELEIDEYKLQVGVRQNTSQTQFAISRTIPLPNTIFAFAQLFIYPQAVPSLKKSVSVVTVNQTTQVNSSVNNQTGNQTSNLTTVYYAQNITISNQLSESLIDYPVEISITDSQVHPLFDWASNEQRLVFKDAMTGELIPYEIRSWSVAGKSAVLVASVSLLSLQTKTLTLYYNDQRIISSQTTPGLQYIVADDFVQPSSSADLLGLAQYDASLKAVRLTPIQNDAKGYLAYDVPHSAGLVAEFSYYAGGGSGADGVFMGVHQTQKSGQEEDLTIGGYIISFDEYAPQRKIGFSQSTTSNGAPIASAPYQYLDGQWRFVRIEYMHNLTSATVKVYLDSVLVLDAIDTTTIASDSGNYLVFGARTGGSTNEHLIKNIFVRQYSSNEPAVQLSTTIDELVG